jgi:hypothetical protein
MFVLIDSGKMASFMSYERRYMLFERYEDCRKEAEIRGFSDQFGMLREAPVPGTRQNMAAGDIDISILNLDVQESSD